MASWVITIAKDFPQHWTYAERDGVWDMPKRFPVAQGDLVYFRIAGGPLIAQCRVTEGARALREDDHVPWDNGRAPYTTRFTFDVLSSSPVQTPSWGEIDRRLSRHPSLQGPRSWTDPRDEAVLASYFEPSELERTLANLLFDGLDASSQQMDLTRLSEDSRVVVEAAQVVRHGQQQFKAALMRAYTGCAVTGTSTETVLDGAHILAYMGEQSHNIRNGLLLRTDIHRLFDAHLLTVTPSHEVRISPDLASTPYAAFDTQPLHLLPQDPDLRPWSGALDQHNTACAWLTP